MGCSGSKIDPNKFIDEEIEGDVVMGATFAKYLGAMPVRKATGNDTCINAVTRIQEFQTKTRDVLIVVKENGIYLKEATGKNNDITSNPVEEISFAFNDPIDKKIFAYIIKDPRLKCNTCHIFEMGNKKDAEAVPNQISHSFKALKESMKSGRKSSFKSALANEKDEEKDSTKILGTFFAKFQKDQVLKQGRKKQKEECEKVWKAVQKKYDKKTASFKGADMQDETVTVIVSSESIRIVDPLSNETKTLAEVDACTYVTMGEDYLVVLVITNKKLKQNTALILWCPDGGNMCKSIGEAFKLYGEALKAMMKNPFAPYKGQKGRELLDGPLKKIELSRKYMKHKSILGQGQFGKVWLATCTQPPKNELLPWIDPEKGPIDVAVKMMKAGASKADKEEFLREAEFMLELGGTDCPQSVLSIVGVSFSVKPWLVYLDYCEHGDCKEILMAAQSKGIVLTEKEFSYIGVQLFEGMTYMEKKHLIHMDLAARNLLLAKNSVCKIADFGLTRKMDEGKKFMKITDAMKLPIRWLAIESITRRVFSHKSDLWTCGITMWEVYSYGAVPYKGTKNPAIIELIKQGKTLGKPEACPENVYALWQRWWKPSPGDRGRFNEHLVTLKEHYEKQKGEVRDIGDLVTNFKENNAAMYDDFE